MSNAWATAVQEWEVIEVEEDPAGRGVCVCGQQNLVQLFTIENVNNQAVLYPIGSTCVNQFGRNDLNRQVDLLGDLLALRKTLRDGKSIELTADHFSRAMLEYFWFQDVFTPDQWNNHDGEGDYEFLLKMFNKRDKDAINRRQQAKIYMLLTQKVLPFVASDSRMK
ncbi:hypothetical protein KXS11_17900 [Plantibacter flavus]|uniref:hypothetical protein n=1 Tax=Plantibacter flavus TaxID=150123 RepID=UPI003F156B64